MSPVLGSHRREASSAHGSEAGLLRHHVIGRFGAERRGPTGCRPALRTGAIFDSHAECRRIEVPPTREGCQFALVDGFVRDDRLNDWRRESKEVVRLGNALRSDFSLVLDQPLLLLNRRHTRVTYHRTPWSIANGLIYRQKDRQRIHLMRRR